MAMFYITPYQPLEWSDWEKTLDHSSVLRIDPDWYKEQLQKHWPNIEFYPPSETEILFWRSPDLPLTYLSTNLHSVILSDPNTAFAVWHRSIIPGEYQLFGWNEAFDGDDAVELKPGMTEEELDRKLYYSD